MKTATLGLQFEFFESYLVKRKNPCSSNLIQTSIINWAPIMLPVLNKVVGNRIKLCEIIPFVKEQGKC